MACSSPLHSCSSDTTLLRQLSCDDGEVRTATTGTGTYRYQSFFASPDQLCLLGRPLGVPRHQSTWLPPTFIVPAATTVGRLVTTEVQPSRTSVERSRTSSRPFGPSNDIFPTHQRQGNHVHGRNCDISLGTSGRISCQSGSESSSPRIV